MARITPKTNWIAGDIPVAPDFNRIENNNEQAFTELDQEVSDRQSAINSAITTEQNARIAADNTLQSNIDNANSARIAGDNNLNLIKAPMPINSSGIGRILNIIAAGSPLALLSFPEPGTWLVFGTASITPPNTSSIFVSTAGQYLCWKLNN
jgi:hypothetical protein